MLIALTFLIMLIVGYSAFREGLFTSVIILVNVVLSGLLAFNFWEPLATLIDPMLQGGFLDGYQDFVLLLGLFCGALALLRVATNNMANYQIEFPAVAQQFGGAAVGLLSGYLVSGFLICLLETIPWHQNFVDYQPRNPGERQFFPADRVWLSLMRHAGAFPFACGADRVAADSPYEQHPTFDRGGTFEHRYWRYRRYSESGEYPKPYLGELDHELRSGP